MYFNEEGNFSIRDNLHYSQEGPRHILDLVTILTASGQPADVHIVSLELVCVNEQKDLLRLLIAPYGSLGLGIVEVESIHIEEVPLRDKIHTKIIKHCL